MSKRNFPRRNRTTAHTLRLKQAIVDSFALPDDEALRCVAGFSNDDWQSAMWWLDISGMAIYFLDRIQQIGGDAVPFAIQQSLELRLQANRVRIHALRQEASTIAEGFRKSQISYALLKGITLVPDSVPESTLRSQADLDFLVAQSSTNLAVESIGALGYKLYATCGNTMEFRAGEASLPDMANIYSERTQRALELHLAAEGTVQGQLLTRRVIRHFDGAPIASLSTSDIFVQQALHLLKHLCGEHTRLSWVLEFWRHANTRASDASSWREIESAAASEPFGDLAISIAVWVAESMFDSVSGTLPSQWSREHIPPRIRLWLERYARNLLLTDNIGNKLYALLRNEIYGYPENSAHTCKILFPFYLPKRVTEPRPNEGIGGRLHRWSVEADFFLRRLCFHVTEGIRFSIEASRWRKATAQCQE